jgi:ATP-dependent Lhr-like helicase
VCAAEDAGRLRDALGVAVPLGLPGVFTESVDAPLVDLVARYARTNGPFLAPGCAAALGVPTGRVVPVLEGLESQGRVLRGEFRPGGVEREWCDDDVLRQLRRRSLATLRREVEPVAPDALSRFLPAWQGVDARRRGIDGLVEVLGQLQGAPLAASVLEADVLPARLDGYRPADLDALCTAGEVVWVGAGGLGAADGRVRLAFRDQAGVLVPTPGEGFDARPHHEVLLAHLAERGASFWPDLVGAAGAADLAYGDADVLAALWDLVWAGLVTNDSLAPVRALVAGRGARPGAPAARRGGGRPRPGRLARHGPPSATGRWSLVAPLLAPAATPTEVAHGRALQLLERYGVLTREAALGEGTEGGFAGVYPVLRALEERGQVRRGYFVAGLGAAQFALPGAVDRLRSFRAPGGGLDVPSLRDAEGGLTVLAATDPAQPFGAALRWPASPGRPARQAGAHVVLADGEPVLYVERGAHALATFAALTERPDWPRSLVGLVARRRYRQIEVRTVDGTPVREVAAAADALRAHGFVDGYKGLVLRSR